MSNENREVKTITSLLDKARSEVGVTRFRKNYMTMRDALSTDFNKLYDAIAVIEIGFQTKINVLEMNEHLLRRNNDKLRQRIDELLEVINDE